MLAAEIASFDNPFDAVANLYTVSLTAAHGMRALTLQ